MNFFKLGFTVVIVALLAVALYTNRKCKCNVCTDSYCKMCTCKDKACGDPVCPSPRRRP